MGRGLGKRRELLFKTMNTFSRRKRAFLIECKETEGMEAAEVAEQRQRQEQHLLRSTAPPVPVADRVLPRRDVEARSASQDVSPRGEVVAAMMGT